MEDIRIIVLSEENIQKYEHLIPDRLQSAIKNENMIALGVVGPEEISMGIAVFREYMHYMELVWIYVEPEFRGMGLGKALINRMEETLSDSDYFIGIFADYQEIQNWEMDLLFASLGYKKESKEWPLYKMNLSDVRTLSNYTDKANQAEERKELCKISECSATMKKHFSFMLHNDKEINFVEFPINWANYDDEISCLYIHKGEIIAALLLENKNGKIVIEYAYAKTNPYVFPIMLAYSYEKVKKQYRNTDPEITLTAFDSSVEKLLQKLVPGAWRMDMAHAEKRLSRG